MEYNDTLLYTLLPSAADKDTVIQPEVDDGEKTLSNSWRQFLKK